MPFFLSRLKYETLHRSKLLRITILKFSNVWNWFALQQAVSSTFLTVDSNLREEAIDLKRSKKNSSYQIILSQNNYTIYQIWLTAKSEKQSMSLFGFWLSDRLKQTLTLCMWDFRSACNMWNFYHSHLLGDDCYSTINEPVWFEFAANSAVAWNVPVVDEIKVRVKLPFEIAESTMAALPWLPIVV